MSRHLSVISLLLGFLLLRITSYNVCYTKLLRLLQIGYRIGYMAQTGAQGTALEIKKIISGSFGSGMEGCQCRIPSLFVGEKECLEERPL